MMKPLTPLWLALLAGIPATAAAAAPAVIPARLMTLELAREIADRTIEACRKQGYQVSVVVVDRAANPQVVLRDIYAPRFTVEIAQRKANAVILGNTSSAEFRKNRADIRQELNELPEILLLAGALPIRAAGALIGAVGVSGAPGGERDEACAAAGLAAVQDQLDFAE